jgi:hypothetical protein
VAVALGRQRLRVVVGALAAKEGAEVVGAIARARLETIGEVVGLLGAIKI